MQLSASGKSTVLNIEQIDRGYENIEDRLRSLGADIKEYHKLEQFLIKFEHDTNFYITIIDFAGFTLSTDFNKLDNVQEVTGINIGNKAPELDFKDPEGNNIKLSSLKGNVVLIDFGLRGVFLQKRKPEHCFCIQ